MADLSPRELEIVKLTAAGLTNQEIAKVLYLSDSTVKAHLEEARRKLGARNRTHLVALAYRVGILEVDRG